MTADRHPALRRACSLLVALAVLLPVMALAAPVEEYAPYDPQRNCRPKAKPGTQELMAWLVDTYPGTGSLGISRACDHGGVSEHKEGRALDWAVRFSSARDRRYVASFLDRIFATDSEGNHAALARRMGIMYLIWNDRVYASYRKFAPRPYLNPACRSKNRCSVTLRHRDHVHISLSRVGGRGDTSWYHRDDPRPTPQPEPAPEPEPEPEPPADGSIDLETRPYARLNVPLDGSVLTTRWTLRAGTRYQLTAAGVYRYGGLRQVADASCVWSQERAEWRPRPSAEEEARFGALGLQVNGAMPLGSGCEAATHTYRVTFTPERAAPLRLRVAHRRADAEGRITVVVSRPGTDVTEALPDREPLSPPPAAPATAPGGYGLVTETVTVPAQARGVTTLRELQQGARYRVTVTGEVALGRGVRSNGSCVQVQDRWYRSAPIDRRDPGGDHGELYLDGRPIAARSPQGCAGAEQVAELVAPRTGRVRLALWDPLDRADNRGELRVLVQRLTPVRGPAAAAAKGRDGSAPWRQERDVVEVDAADPRGARTGMAVKKGQRVRLVVSGRYDDGGTAHDATCLRVDGRWTTADPALLLGQDLGELWVDGAAPAWRAAGPGAGCDTTEHRYVTTLTATKSGRLRLAVLDLDHRDNRGVLEVRLRRLG